MADFVEEPKAGVPAWMVSFGDMMTLILTLFILLVSLSKEQQEGLMARGIGSFIVATRSFGLDGLLGEAEKATIFAKVRQRFNLPREDDPERRDQDTRATNLELIRAKVAEGLRPHGELTQPAVAVFASDSAELSAAAQRYLDLLAPTLRPNPGQLLLLEGHAQDAGPAYDHDDHRLAYDRARAVRKYLVEQHHFRALRVEARAWLEELSEEQDGFRTVDARLITPDR